MRWWGILCCVMVVWGGSLPPRRVMLWLDLDGANHSEVWSTYAQVVQYRDALTAVSVVTYGINETMGLEVFTKGGRVYCPECRNLTTTISRELGLQTFPLISPMIANVSHLNRLFDDPMPFIKQAVSEAEFYNYSGYNLDFEFFGAAGCGPTYLSLRFAVFLTQFSRALHAVGRWLSIDTNGCPLLNIQILKFSEVDVMANMGTYGSNVSGILATLADTLSLLKADSESPNSIPKLGVGLSHRRIRTAEDIGILFAAIESHREIREIDLWCCEIGQGPLGPVWVQHLKHFLALPPPPPL